VRVHGGARFPLGADGAAASPSGDGRSGAPAGAQPVARRE
jgi:hypothetical protein